MSVHSKPSSTKAPIADYGKDLNAWIESNRYKEIVKDQNKKDSKSSLKA